jgi:hypothetical protein
LKLKAPVLESVDHRLLNPHFEAPSIPLVEKVALNESLDYR